MGVLVVEGLKLLPPAPGPGGRQLGRGTHQPVQLILLLHREARVVLQPQLAGVGKLRGSPDLVPAHGVDGLAERGGAGGNGRKSSPGFGRCAPIPEMTALLISELVSVTLAGSPPCSAKSAAKRCPRHDDLPARHAQGSAPAAAGQARTPDAEKVKCLLRSGSVMGLGLRIDHSSHLGNPQLHVVIDEHREGKSVLVCLGEEVEVDFSARVTTNDSRCCAWAGARLAAGPRR
jgi:hypothetical protein